MKKRNMGKRLSIITIILVFIVVIMFLLIFNQWMKNIGDNERESIHEKVATKTDKEKYQKVFYDNGWDREIVKEVKEDVPIPNGFEYVSGNKDTGLIIEDSENKQKMMWIPYDENVLSESSNQYYSQVSYDTIDLKSYKNMTKYGGFYVLLSEQNDYETLKDIDQSTYDQTKERAKKVYESNEIVNSHLAYKAEIEQIMAFSSKIGIDITKTKNDLNANAFQGEKLISTNIEKLNNKDLNFSAVIVNMETDTYLGKGSDSFNQKNWYLYETPIIITTPSGKELSVPIPVGFNAEVNNNVVTITSQGEYKLSYVWVPVNEEFNTKDFSESGIKELNNNLKQIYGIADRTQGEILSYTEDPIQTTEYQILQKSIETYGGFYMGQAELGFDNETSFNNQTRGLNYITDQETGEKEAYAKNGDYYRTVYSKTVKENTMQNHAKYENSLLEQNEDGGYILTYDKAKELAKKANGTSTTTSSNLIYGAQWNAALLWILKSNNNYSLEDFLVNSENLPGAKYEKTKWESEVSYIKTINGLSGIAGNLSDLTQEKYRENSNGIIKTANVQQEEYCIGRGGNYGTTGQEKTASGYQIVSGTDVQKESIGIRDCLILHVEAGDDQVLKSNEKELSSKNNNYQVKKASVNTINQPGLLQGNGKALLIADLIHSWFTRHGAQYNSDVIKPVPSDASETDCSHYMSMILYEYGHRDPFLYDYCNTNKSTNWCGNDYQYTTTDFSNMAYWNESDNDYGQGPRDYFGLNEVEIMNKDRWQEETIPGDMVVMYNGSHVQMYAGNNRWYNAGMNRYISESKWNGLVAPYYDDGTLNPGKNPWTWNVGIRLVGADQLSYDRMKELFENYNSQGWSKSSWNIEQVRSKWGDDQAVIYVLKNFGQSRGLIGGNPDTYIDRCL